MLGTIAPIITKKIMAMTILFWRGMCYRDDAGGMFVKEYVLLMHKKCVGPFNCFTVGLRYLLSWYLKLL